MAFSLSGWTALDLVAIIIFAYVLNAFHDRRKRGGLPYPPGPKGLPFMGNLFDIPLENSWVAWTNLGKRYGDIFSLNVFGQLIVVVQSPKIAYDLLDKRSNKYSDRLPIPFYELAGWQWITSLARFGEQWRLARRSLERGMRPSAIVNYRHAQTAKVHTFLNHLLQDPENFADHIAYLQGSLLIAVAYGIDVKGRDDWNLTTVQKAVHLITTTALPNAVSVNMFPFLRHLPEWLPGMGFKSLARRGHELAEASINEPWNTFKEAAAQGTAPECIGLHELRERESDSDEEERAVVEALGSLYLAGSDTTSGSLLAFFLMLARYPAIQERAQAELDAVTGRTRLPTFEDRPNLPYVNALCKEVLRWRMVTPLGVPHTSIEDDVYEGYFIPKGSLIVANAWYMAISAMFRDPTVYPDPETFNPERFLTAEGQFKDDPRLNAIFGFGKRICPGRFLAESTIFLTAAMVLSTFFVGRPKGSSEQAAIDNNVNVGQAIAQPQPFQCSISPRSAMAEELIAAVAETPGPGDKDVNPV
ncbi:cytochrome P450 [Auriscalpium vulgare]|uniref:Cytochrome P450 n=1 Tax=Auriscalpium vulgare TaxID=40419 RepID=A0ACB8S1J3_9AGAM|nr:cytochrome P450 [Auriscalpium vulgare]